MSSITITVSAADLASAYFDGRISGCVKAPEGMTSGGFPVKFISVSKGAHRITLTGIIPAFRGCKAQRWEQTFPAVPGAPIDD